MKIAACSVVCALLCAVLKPHEVALGVSDDSYVQILSGLSQGETVLVPDQGQDQVQIQPDGSAAMAGSGGEG